MIAALHRWNGRARNRVRAAAPALLAVAAGAVGEGLLFPRATREAGAVLLAVAMLLAGVAWRRATAPEEPEPPPQRLPLSRGHAAAFAAACALTLAALGAWFADRDATFGAQGVLWLAAMAVFAGACARWGARAAARGPRWTRLEVGGFAGLLVLALFTFLADLNDVPWRFHYDEAIAFQEAMRFHEGPHISLFTTTWHDTGLPSMWFGVAGSLMHLAGTDLGGVRFAVALVGALTIVPLYGLARLLTGPGGAVFASFAWATTPAVVHYSRVSIDNMTTAFFWTACFFFAVRALRSHAPLDFGLAGLFAGLSMYTYYGTRLLPILLLAAGAHLMLFHRRPFRELRLRLGLVAVGFVVGFGPLLAYFLAHPRMWAGRGAGLLVGPGDLVPMVRLNFLGLSVISSEDHIYWAPFLSPVAAVLVVLGTGVLLRRWRAPGPFLILLWGIGVLVVGGVLVDRGHAPALNHWTPAFPAFFVALAVPVALCLEALRRVGEKWWRLGCAATAAGALALAGANAHAYLVSYPKTVPPAFESAQGRFLEGLPDGARVRFVGNSWLPFLPVVAEMVAPHVHGSDLLNPSRSLPLDGERGDLRFVFNDDQEQYLPLLARIYPGGVRGRISTPGGPVGWTYRVSAARPRAPRPGGGLVAIFEGRGGSMRTRIDPFVAASVLRDAPALRRRDPDYVSLAPPGVRVLRARWLGQVLTSAGRYTLELRTDAHARLWVDGRDVLDLCDHAAPPGALYGPDGLLFVPGGLKGRTAQVELAAGWHDVRLDLEATGRNSGLEWTWTRPDGVREIVPPDVLRHTSRQLVRPSALAPIRCG